MNERGWVVFIGGAMILSALASLLEGCGAGTPSTAQQSAVAVDAAEQRACVERPDAGIGRAAMAKEIDDCLAAVKLKRDHQP